MTLASEILADGPEAYWKHPGGSTTDADQSGNGRDLTWTSAPSASAIVESNGVTLAANKEASRADEAWMHATSWTLEWWHQSAATGAGLFSVVSRRSGVDRWAVYIRRAVGDIQLLAYPGAVSAFSTATYLLDGGLHHCAVEIDYDGANTSYAFYVDGEPAGSGSLLAGSIDTGSEPWRAWGENGSRRFTGEVAHMAFHSTALSPERIARHYHSIFPLTGQWTVGLGSGGMYVPRGSNWKYKQIGIADAADYSSPAYDDSAWSTGQAPFGQERSGGVLTYPYPSHFDLESRLWTRYRLTLSTLVTGLRIFGQADNEIAVWWNGTQIGLLNLVSGGDFSFAVPRSAQTVGVNVIACRTTDDATTGDPDGAFFDAGVRSAQTGWTVSH